MNGTRDFDKFRRQLARLSLFALSGSGNYLAAEGIPLLSRILPAEWLPDVRVQLDSERALSCGESYEPEPLVIYSALYALQTYRMFVSDEAHCHNHNERLVLDQEGHFRCICAEGKSCSNESNFETILTVLMAILITLMAAWVMSTLFSTFTIKREIARLLLVQQQQ